MRLFTRTRRCPHCAERIQALAMKCRYCQGAVTPLAESPAHDDELPPDSATHEGPAPEEPAPEEPGEREPSGRRRFSLYWTAIVAGLVIAVACGIATYGWAREADDLEARQKSQDEVRSMVAEPVEALLSYDYRTFDDGREAVVDTLTDAFRAEYAPTLQEVRERALKQERSQIAYVVGVSVVSSDIDRVKALVFVNTLSSRVGETRKQLLQNRVVVTMLREGDDWRIGDLTIPVA